MNADECVAERTGQSVSSISSAFICVHLRLKSILLIEQSAMSMIGNYRRLSEEQLAALQADPFFVPAFLCDEAAESGEHLNLDKSWHAIHFLLNRQTGVVLSCGSSASRVPVRPLNGLTVYTTRRP